MSLFKAIQSDNPSHVNYRKLDSLVEGITVFAPDSLDVSEEEGLKVYKCPNCGANIGYDVSLGGISCKHCGFSTSPQNGIVGQKADEFEFTIETINEAEKGWGIERKYFHCNSCGADLSITEGKISLTCPFCASNEVNVQVSGTSILRPKFIIPFKITHEATKTIINDWIGRGWYHPDDLKLSTVLDRTIGVYLPFWTFDAQIKANWKALVGNETEHRYYDQSSNEWRTRTEIEWQRKEGEISLSIDDLLVSGSSHISNIILDHINPFSLSDLERYNPDYLAGWQAHAYDITLLKAWEKGKSLIRDQAKHACYSDTGSNHIRDFSMLLDFSNETWRYILLPTYLSSYRYQEKIFQVIINGQTGTIAGQKPVAWWKIWVAIGALLSPGLCLGLSGIPLLFAGGVGILPIIIGVIALIIGTILATFIYQSAQKSEAI